jgi:hypothetical protein
VNRPHGNANTYRKEGCRCTPCTAANSAERAAYRKRVYLARGKMLTDNAGTVRRLQALSAIGWGLVDLSAETGMAIAALGRLRAGTHATHRRTRQTIAELYDRLSMTPGPSQRARDYAARAGWLPPLAWDDDDIDDPGAWGNVTIEDDTPDPVVVERLCADPTAWRHGLAATRTERLAAAHILGAWSHKALGYSGTDAKRGAA